MDPTRVIDAARAVGAAHRGMAEALTNATQDALNEQQKHLKGILEAERVRFEERFAELEKRLVDQVSGELAAMRDVLAQTIAERAESEEAERRALAASSAARAAELIRAARGEITTEIAKSAQSVEAILRAEMQPKPKE